MFCNSNNSIVLHDNNDIFDVCWFLDSGRKINVHGTLRIFQERTRYKGTAPVSKLCNNVIYLELLLLCLVPTDTFDAKNLQTAVLRWYKKEIGSLIAFETCFHYHQEPQLMHARMIVDFQNNCIGMGWKWNNSFRLSVNKIIVDHVFFRKPLTPHNIKHNILK